MLSLFTVRRAPLKSVLNLFLQGRCPLCDRPTPANFCLACQTNLQQQTNCPPANWQSPLPVLAWRRYEGSLKRAIAALKYQHQPQIGFTLGTWLGETWQQQVQICNCRPVVVPIPLHPNKLQQRGYNQAELIAQGFCRVTGLALAAHGLQRVQMTEAQFSLSAQARWQNLAQAFELGPHFQPHKPTAPVLLIDDIYTTGATATSAADTLRRQQISVLGIGAIARSMAQANN
ncbi:MAG: ComF family protein [Leptolyngbyaceae cyanobacterium SM1_1_3]|nr:ComF family protein [Leptolyngbyaceae cyanobacterium SM1_1_3]NJN02310.1 ComF family protein [Leptolyngbyaceae cyanobacterium RM1_1_2]